MSIDKNILNFWDGRSKLGELAGTNDFMLTRIEQKFILDTIPDNSRVFDIGCGNALSLVALAKEKNCSGVGIDFSAGMVSTSQEYVYLNNLQDEIKTF